jgi:hypothetical protein
MGPSCSSAETQVCHRSYIIAARFNTDNKMIHTDLLLNIESMYKMFSERNLLACNTFYALAERRPDIKCPSPFVFYALTLISLVQLLDNFYKLNLPIIYRSSSYLVISPLLAKAEGDYSFRFRPSVRPSH